jgi:macrolide-specific efflux system membrane fusion protein
MPSIAANRKITVALLSALALLPFVSAVRSADPPAAPVATSTITVTGITKPSEERHLAFAGPGIVSNVSIKEGDMVKKAQVLAAQDSRQDQFALKSFQREADSNDKVEYSKKDLALKEVQYKRKVYLQQHDAASQSELDEAKLAVELAAAQIAMAELEHDQKNYDAEKEKVKIEQMQIISPIDGIVEKLNIGEGEMADPQNKEGSIIVGQWNPLWLEVHLESAQASQLKLNQELLAKYDGGQWQPAKIIFFEKVDATSDTQMVRLELPNPDNARYPGLHMQIKLPEGVTGVAAGQ